MDIFLKIGNDFRSMDMLFHQISLSILKLNALDKSMLDKLEQAYANAKETVPWKDSFALIDIKEYFASGVSYSYLMFTAF